MIKLGLNTDLEGCLASGHVRHSIFDVEFFGQGAATDIEVAIDGGFIPGAGVY